jgi:hypothetical protein
VLDEVNQYLFVLFSNYVTLLEGIV